MNYNRTNWVLTLITGISFLCINVFSANAQVKVFPHGNETISAKMFEVLDVAFTCNNEIQNPFKEDFGATFTSPDGKEMQIPGFYNGNNQWLLRFSANKTGLWKYTTYSNINKLANKSGEINVGEAESGKHGGVIISPENKQKFCYEDGAPYYLMAYECDWLYALDFHNDDDAPKTKHFLDLLAKNGCTQIVMNVFSYDVSWPKDEKLKKYPEHDVGGPKDIFPFLGNNENPDFSSLNPAFFQKLDRTISLMNDRGIVSHLMIYVWNKLVNWPEMYSDADNLYFDYVVKRYQAFPNMLFDISKEALYYGRADDEYIIERIKRARELNVYDRLVTVHDFGFCTRHPEKVDFISLQDWTSELYNLTINTVKKYSDKPIFNIEHGGYEESPYEVWTGTFTDAEICLRRNYLIAFGGGYTSYYWQGCSWNVLIHNPYEQPDDFIRPKFEYYRHMTAFFEEHNFADLKPEPSKNRSTYCLSDDKGKYMFYVPKYNYMIQPNFLKETVGKRSFVWYNTLTGEYKPHNDDEIISKWQGDIHLKSPWQGEADAILVTEIVKQ
ncbi:DUF5060 domain-containing protein [uncultured Draconibacterium sp.]|uniref:DUF5060 domain-containing protein n=1 Tax=uncultured Draconibacterium sp. TaxID=1573823 RepID=UPI0025CF82B1|nr:DUF5060 domain-containing protein [uncultured Draconibacterium sp.]